MSRGDLLALHSRNRTFSKTSSGKNVNLTAEKFAEEKKTQDVKAQLARTQEEKSQRMRMWRDSRY